MSWQAIRAALELSEATGAACLVLLVLAEHAHEDGEGSFPNYDTIAAEANIGRGTIRPSLERLQELGEIQLAGRLKSGTRVWRISLLGGSMFELADGSTVELPDAPNSSGGEYAGSSGFDLSSMGEASGSMVEHEPSVEPSVESPKEPRPFSNLEEGEIDEKGIAELEEQAKGNGGFARVARVRLEKLAEEGKR